MQQVEDELNKFLKKLEGVEGVYCLPDEIEIIFPSACAVDDPEARLRGIKREKDCPWATGELRSLMLDLFGGATIYNAIGGWYDDKLKSTIIEPVMVFRVGHNCQDAEKIREMGRKLEEIAKKTGQRSLTIVKDSKFLFVPPEALIKGGHMSNTEYISIERSKLENELHELKEKWIKEWSRAMCKAFAPPEEQEICLPAVEAKAREVAGEWEKGMRRFLGLPER
jgi:hypothetical protein